ncbi:hypothetical protein NLJ89_g3747 [Agrocybe chaxingu]|uniref:Uncharacterized protein n=1 Tax=Agrocybe chaxingu TaxID=84603 RepID=A0A9W8K4N4_9AGAR|nr:hypothetical protein NLJ89_g3747 [Agrocybe chaxingu]
MAPTHTYTPQLVVKPSGSLQHSQVDPHEYLPLAKRVLPPFVSDDLVAKLKADPLLAPSKYSKLYTLEASTLRLWAADGRNDVTVNKLSAITLKPNSFDEACFHENTSRTAHHYAAAYGDILLMHEYLYLGAIADKPDKQGFTPIFMALAGAAILRADITINGYSGPRKITLLRQGPSLLKRFSYIARMLIEQHIDVNQIHCGYSLLHLALLAKDWDTATLLFEHGAHNNLSAKELNHCVRSNEDRKKFAAAESKKIPKGAERPARLCPCSSGKPLLECHADPEACIHYPPSFLCFCGKDKAYQKCCMSKIAAFETWGEEKQKIGAHIETFGKDDKLRAAVRRFQALDLDYDGNGSVSSSSKGLPFAGLTQENMDKFRKEMIRLNKVDPAFAHGMSKMRFPLPISRSYGARGLRAAHQLNWNAAIEEYIHSGTDPRSRFEIERAAKIGTWGGALIRQCQGPDCTNVEDRNLKAFSQCSACQINSQHHSTNSSSLLTMSTAIVLPTLTQWTKNHITALIQASNNTDLDAALDAFLSKDASLTVNGVQVSRQDFAKQVQIENFDEAGASIAFRASVEVSKNQDKPFDTGSVGVFYTAIISQAIRIRDAPVNSQVTASVNVVIEQDPSIPPPPPSHIHGFFDGRRVKALNQVIIQGPVTDQTFS